MSGVSAAAVQVAVAAATMAAGVAVQASSMMGIQDRSRSSHVVSEMVQSRRVENEAVVLDQEQDQDDLILNSPPVLPTGRHSFVRSCAA